MERNPAVAAGTNGTGKGSGATGTIGVRLAAETDRVRRVVARGNESLVARLAREAAYDAQSAGGVGDVACELGKRRGRRDWEALVMAGQGIFAVLVAVIVFQVVSWIL